MARAFLFGAYSYGSWRTSQKDHIRNPHFPLQMRTALFVQDVIWSPFLLPTHIYTDLKIEQDSMNNFLINCKYQHNNVQQVPKDLLHLPRSCEYGCSGKVIYTQIGEGTRVAQSSKQGSRQNN